MAHFGMLRDYRFSDDVDDIRGATLYGVDDDKLGKIDDVIFDHATGTISYAVVDTGGWLSSKKFLVPAERIRPDTKHEDDFFVNATKQQIETLPKYDENAVATDPAWNNYDRDYRGAWEKGPLLQKQGSTHTITPGPEELPAGTGTGAGEERLTPDRMAGVFTDPAPNSGKLRMRPAGTAAKAEDSSAPGAFQAQDKTTGAAESASTSAASTSAIEAQRDHLTEPDELYVSERDRHGRWSAFEDHLRRNRVDVTSACRSCETAKDKVA